MYKISGNLEGMSTEIGHATAFSPAGSANPSGSTCPISGTSSCCAAAYTTCSGAENRPRGVYGPKGTAAAPRARASSSSDHPDRDPQPGLPRLSVNGGVPLHVEPRDERPFRSFRRRTACETSSSPSCLRSSSMTTAISFTFLGAVNVTLHQPKHGQHVSCSFILGRFREFDVSMVPQVRLMAFSLCKHSTMKTPPSQEPPLYKRPDDELLAEEWRRPLPTPRCAQRK